MTESENNASQLENTAPNSVSNSLKASSLDFYYTLLNDTDAQFYRSPVDGFLNVLFPPTSNACICPYFLKQETHVIRGGENTIHPIKKGELLEWKTIYKGNVAILLYFSNELVPDLDKKFKAEPLRFKNGLSTKTDNRTKLLLEQLINALSNDNLLNQVRCQSLLLEVLIHQVEGLYAENEKHELIPNKDHYEKIILAKNLIHQDLSKNYTIPELAKHVGTNEQYLKKYFKQHFGKTVMNYITAQKMEHAKSLILTGEYRIADVARMTGYKHSTHFTTAFKKYFGFIPNSLKYSFMMVTDGIQYLAEIESLINNL